MLKKKKIFLSIYKKHKLKNIKEKKTKNLKNNILKIHKNINNYLSNFLMSSFGFSNTFNSNNNFNIDFNNNKYSKLKYFNYNLINFNLGNKRGGIGDTSHWSSGTEYLNEQFKRIYSPFNSKYVISNNGIKNHRFIYGGEFETQHTDKDYFIKSNNKKRKGISLLYKKPRSMAKKYKKRRDMLMSDVDGPIDNFYDRKRSRKKIEMFSYIDWGFNTDHDNLNSDINFINSDIFTADLQRDPSTESVYIDIIQNEYIREMRDFPEEIVDWTVSDFYTELINNAEITDLPNSTNESELYSIDSSNSISDFYLGSDINSELGNKTLYISEEMSTDYNDFNLQNQDRNKNNRFSLFNDLNKILELDSSLKPKTNINYDIFSSPNFISNKNNNLFEDFKNKSYLESTINEDVSGYSRTDSNKIELEDNTRETETFFRQSKYIDSFRFESIFDEIIVNLNINKNNNYYKNIIQIISINNTICFKTILYTKTNYLKNYRGIMLDLGLGSYMF